jgi:hypothetical protein
MRELWEPEPSWSFNMIQSRVVGTVSSKSFRRQASEIHPDTSDSITSETLIESILPRQWLMPKPELVCRMKRLERKETVSWAVTQMRDLEGQHAISTNRVEATFQAREEAITMKVEVMGTDFSKMITARSPRGATTPDQTADARTMTTVEVTLGPNTDAIATVMMTAEVAATVDDVTVIATMTVEATGMGVNQPETPMPTLELILDFSPGHKAILSRDMDVMTTTAVPRSKVTAVGATMESGQTQDMDDLSATPMSILKLTHVTAGDKTLIVTAPAAMIVHSMANTLALPNMKADRNSVIRAILIQDMTTGHSDRSKGATPRGVIPKEVVQIRTKDTNKGLAKLATTLLTLSAPALWTKDLESLIYAGMATPKTRLTLSSLRSCTSTASFSSSMTSLLFVAQPT